MQSTYKSILETDEMTVVTEYNPLIIDRTQYQSEADLENEFIKRLLANGYERLTVNSETELINNLRIQIEKLNKYDDKDRYNASVNDRFTGKIAWDSSYSASHINASCQI